MPEGLQVLQRFAARHPPRPLLADGGGEAEFEQGVEVVVRRLHHLTEDAVEFIGVDHVERHPADEVDVADVVQRVGHPVEPAVALEQKPVNALEVLVRLAADERLHAHRVLADAQQGVGGQFAFARQFDDDAWQTAVGARIPGEVQAVLDQGILDEPLDARGGLPGRDLAAVLIAHARTPRRSVQRRPCRRAVTSRAALRRRLPYSVIARL